MDRLDYFIRRILLIIPTFIGITFLCFTIIQFVPGGPVEQAIMRMRGGGEGGETVSANAGEAGPEALRIRPAVSETLLEMACDGPDRPENGIL